MAPPTIPTEVKRRRGTLRKDRTPVPPSAVLLVDRVALDVPPPPSLGSVGSAEWDHALRTCVWLAPSDLTALRMFCEAVDRREEFGRALVGHTCPQCGHLDEHQTSLMLETSTGYAYINPAAVGVKQMEEQIAKWMSVLGMTPSARGALGVAEVKAASTLDKLAARKRALVETGGLRASTPSSRRRQSEPETETTS